jgi:hypothetical protein
MFHHFAEIKIKWVVKLCHCGSHLSIQLGVRDKGGKLEKEKTSFAIDNMAITRCSVKGYKGVFAVMQNVVKALILNF